MSSRYAEIAQLVEHNLAKVRVASSSLVFRSKGLFLEAFFIWHKLSDPNRQGYLAKVPCSLLEEGWGGDKQESASPPTVRGLESRFPPPNLRSYKNIYI